jgi:hypothetical protein
MTHRFDTREQVQPTQPLRNPKKRPRHLRSTNTTGYRGVYVVGRRFKAEITVNSKRKSLGRYDTAKEAALAFDAAVHKFKLEPYRLNYPNGLPTDDPDYDEFMNPEKKQRLQANNTSGYRGVYKMKKKYQSKINVHNKTKYLGAFNTPKEAAVAFDEAVIEFKLPSYKLNFPNDYDGSLYWDIVRDDDEISAQQKGSGSGKKSKGKRNHKAKSQPFPSPQAPPPTMNQLDAADLLLGVASSVKTSKTSKAKMTRKKSKSKPKKKKMPVENPYRKVYN